jgi:hypothetical protein
MLEVLIDNNISAMFGGRENVQIIALMKACNIMSE